MSADTNPTIFGAILRGEIPSTRVWEDEHCIAFRDIHPAAPTHVLIIPRKHIPTLAHMEEEDRFLVGHLHWVATQVAAAEGLTERGYRLVFNVGEGGGQTVFHLHLHLLGGRQVSWPPG
jgi:histidine triad (HIT) family protein